MVFGKQSLLLQRTTPEEDCIESAQIARGTNEEYVKNMWLGENIVGIRARRVGTDIMAESSSRFVPRMQDEKPRQVDMLAMLVQQMCLGILEMAARPCQRNKWQKAVR